MSLASLLEVSRSRDTVQKKFITEDRIKNNISYFQKLIAYFRQYPDIFIDFIKGEDCNFEFLFYQRIFLRIVMRHRYVFATFPRRVSAG